MMFFNKDKNKEKSLTPAEEKIMANAKEYLSSSGPIYELYPVEWVEVKGYKAVTKDLTSFHDKNFVYKINEPNFCEGEIELCRNGLHFCPNLEDIPRYANILCSRIFEVTAIIDKNYIDRKNYLQRQKDKCYCDKTATPPQYKDLKLVAKSMTFVRELSEEEIYEKFKDTLVKHPVYFNLINSIEDFKTLRFKAKEELKFLSIKKHYKALVEAGYSKTYAKILVDSLIIQGSRREGTELFNLAIAYAEEGLSPDMRAYLLASKLK